jgi:hypothetical protein
VKNAKISLSRISFATRYEKIEPKIPNITPIRNTVYSMLSEVI